MVRSAKAPVRAGICGAGAGAGAAGAGVEACAGAGAGAAGAGAGVDVETDLEGFTSQASSSNPSAFDFFSETGADASGVGVASAGLLTVPSVFCSNAFASTTSLV
jgi:hypothetical protein